MAQMRNGVTLLELILSIVIMAIGASSFALMLDSANKSADTFAIREGFAKAATLLVDASSRSFDSDADANETEQNMSLIFKTKSVEDENLSRDENNSGYRAGSIKEYSKRRLYQAVLAKDIPTAQTLFSLDSNKRSISEYNNNYGSFEGFDVNISVSYAPDTAVADESNKSRQSATWILSSQTTNFSATNSTNLKRISVKIGKPSGAGRAETEFFYFSANIGERGFKTK